MRDAADIRWSFNGVKHRPFADRGRTGYSVKLVALNSIENPSEETADGATTWTNRLDLDESARFDLPFLKH